MKRKLSSIIVALVLALGIAFAVPVGGVKADAETKIENGSITLASTYKGILLETDTDATFDLGTIDLTGVNVSKPIMQFLPWTEKRGDTYNDALATYGTFTIEFTSGAKSLSVTSLFRGNNEFILGAKGENQDRYTSFDWSRGVDNDPPNASWNDSAGTTLPFRKDGSYIGRRMGLADGTNSNASAVAMTPVGIYLSLGDKVTIWSDVTIDHANYPGKNGGVGFMLDDNLPAETGETPNYWRFPIRNLDVQVGDMPAWIPFTAEELRNVNVSFSISGVTADTKMLVTGLYDNVLTADVLTKGLVGVEYTLPTPAILTDTVSDFVGAGGTYKIMKGAEEEKAETAWTPGTTFTPATAGTYEVTYSVDVNVNPDPAEVELVTKTVSIEVADTLPDAQINLTTPEIEGATAYLGDVVNLGATVTNENQKLAQSLTLSIARNGSDIFGMQNVPVSGEYIFDTNTYPHEGRYTLTYRTTDLLGRTVEKVVETYISRTYVSFVGGIGNTMYYEKGADVLRPSIADVEAYDIIENVVVAPSSVEIEVVKPDNTVADVADVDFVAEGVYTVKYALQYVSVETPGVIYTANTERMIFVFAQDIPVITIEALPINVTAKAGATVADDIIKVKAIVGSDIVFPYGYFMADYAIESVEQVKASTGAITDVTAKFLAGEYVFTPDAVDTYTFSARINNGRYYAVRSVEIEVVKAGYQLQAMGNRTATVGDKLNNLAPIISDYYGNVVAKDKIVVEVFFNYEKIGGEGTVASAIGQYEVKYVFDDTAVSGEKIEGSYLVTVIDDEKPVITLSEKKTSSLRGKFVKIATPTITDKSGANINPEIVVLKDGKSITVYNGGFTANTKGKYEVIYTAIDAAGNQQIVTYVVEVSSASVGLVIGLSVGGGVLVLLIAGAVVLLILNKKGVIDLKKIFAKKEKPVSDEFDEDEVAEVEEEVSEETTPEEEK